MRRSFKAMPGPARQASRMGLLTMPVCEPEFEKVEYWFSRPCVTSEGPARLTPRRLTAALEMDAQ
jgi:hypothetical protein